MISTTEVFTDNSPRSPMTLTPAKKVSARKSLYILTNILDAKKKTATRQIGAAKFKGKAIKYKMVWKTTSYYYYRSI